MSTPQLGGSTTIAVYTALQGTCEIEKLCTATADAHLQQATSDVPDAHGGFWPYSYGEFDVHDDTEFDKVWHSDLPFKRDGWVCWGESFYRITGLSRGGGPLGLHSISVSQAARTVVLFDNGSLGPRAREVILVDECPQRPTVDWWDEQRRLASSSLSDGQAHNLGTQSGGDRHG